MLKEKLLSYIKEQTKQADFDHVDKSCTAVRCRGSLRETEYSQSLSKQRSGEIFI